MLKGWTGLSLDLAFRDGDLGSNSLLALGDSMRVAVRPLADILADADVPGVDLLKVDVEEFEDRVLCPFIRDASPRLLPAAIILEHCSRADWQEDLMGELARAGYREKARRQVAAG